MARLFLRFSQPRAPRPSISRSDSVAGTGLEREPHARRAAGARRKLVDAERADAIVLAAAASLDDPVRSIDLDERHVSPAEAVAWRLDAKARPRSKPDGVDPREMPINEVVVGELRMVRDVLQVAEDPLARSIDDDRHGHRVHGDRQSSARPC